MLKILRLNHRTHRDARLTTHVALTARALGAEEFILSGDKDQKLLDGVDRVTVQFGGPFETKYVQRWRPWLKQQRQNGFKIVHLTAYGHGIQDKIKTIRKWPNLVLIIGSAKVPPEVYELADYNIAVGNQPHSEASATAIFLHEYFQGKELEKDFIKAKKKIIPGDKKLVQDI